MANFTSLSARCGLLVGLAGLSLGSCFCYDEVNTENPLKPEDLDDTAPVQTPFDATLDFNGRYGVENFSVERFRFDVVPFADDAEREKANQLFRSHAALLRQRTDAIPSVQTLWTYVKQLDDTIYAGVERAIQDGLLPTIAPKREILIGASEFLAANRSAVADEALVQAAAAVELGGGTVDVPADLLSAVADRKAIFMADAANAKPIGFYTWSSELQAIWLQDRLLQQPLAAESACALALAISANAQRKAAYVQLTDLVSRLTNPLESSLRSLLDTTDQTTCAASSGPRAFLGPSRSAEVDLFRKLYPDGVPESADLMQDLIDAIRDGSVDLTPTDVDGWYSHKTYALETLLVTDRAEERAKIGFTARYKKRLQEAFATMLVQTRETHVKQLSMAVGMAGPPETPHFRLEPLATVYGRLARSYLFLEAALDAVMGPELLDQGHAVGASGMQHETLRSVVERAAGLAFGMYAIACQDIGLKPLLDQAGDPAQEQLWGALASDADAWLANLASDPIADSDVRVVVPIADMGGGCFKLWAVIGVRTTLAGYSYIQGMDMGAPAVDKQSKVALPTEQFLEVTSCGGLLTRDEFHALCDANQTADAIKAALEAR